MIKIAGTSTDSSELLDQFPPNSMERGIVLEMNRSEEVYRYNTESQLWFEVTLRKNIVHSSEALNRSRFAFRTFRESRCNPDYWLRTNEGGFLLENDVKPSDAVRDILKNSSAYGTECATAMIVIYLLALVDLYPEPLFNRMFSRIYLMNWQHVDRDLGLTDFPQVADELPGDARYFRNPDVDPETPEWQGENVFALGGGMYFGHGIGIADARNIIRALNGHRVEGSDRSAYLLPSCKRLNFRYLAMRYDEYMTSHQPPAPMTQPFPEYPPSFLPRPPLPPLLL